MYKKLKHTIKIERQLLILLWHPKATIVCGQFKKALKYSADWLSCFTVPFSMAEEKM